MISAAFDTIISRLEAAQPLRLAAELKDFRNARTSDDLRIVRSELVTGGMLAAAGVGFDFGARGGTPQPDLVLREKSPPAPGPECAHPWPPPSRCRKMVATAALQGTARQPRSAAVGRAETMCPRDTGPRQPSALPAAARGGGKHTRRGLPPLCN